MELYKEIPIPEFTKIPRMLQCKTSLLRQIFKISGYGEIGNYIGKELLFYQYKDPCLKDIPKISRRNRNYFVELSEDHGFKFRPDRFDSAENAWEHIRRLLENDMYCLAKVDAFYIPYSPLYMNDHQPHYICFNGIAEERQTVYVYDTSYNRFNEEYNMEIIQKAWSENDFFAITILKSDKFKEIDYNNFKKIIQDNISNMTNPNKEYIYINNSQIGPIEDYQDNEIGLDAIYSFGEAVSRIPKESNYTKTLRDLYILIANIAEETELHAFFLMNMFNRFEITDEGEMIDNLKNIAQQWYLLKNMFMKGSFSGRYEMIQWSANKIFQIAAQEKTYIEDLMKLKL